MGYDDWRTETDRDYEHRMHVHDRGPLPVAEGGRCLCGVDTTRSVAGIGWQCKPCGESDLIRLFGVEIAERTQRERNDALVTRYLRRA